MRKRVRETGVPARVGPRLVFADGREWHGAAGAAVLRPRRAMTSATALPLDGVTEVATAALALRLAERGRLGLDDPITRWYREWRGDRQATVRDLLGHTSGLGNPPDAFWQHVLEQPRQRVSARQFIAATPRPGPRTTEAEYSNTGFVIAGLILERAAQEPLAAVIRREVLSLPGGDGLAFQPAERRASSTVAARSPPGFEHGSANGARAGPAPRGVETQRSRP